MRRGVLRFHLDPRDGILTGVRTNGSQPEGFGRAGRVAGQSAKPSGRLIPAEELLRLHEAASALGAITIVDEAFIDYAPQDSLVPWAARIPGLIVLRSLTKFFAMPGLRVAYAVSCPETRTAMESRIPAWPVGSIAAEAARMVLQDQPSIIQTRVTNATERDWLEQQLQGLGVCVFPSAANYLLIKSMKAAMVRSFGGGSLSSMASCFAPVQTLRVWMNSTSASACARGRKMNFW